MDFVQRTTLGRLGFGFQGLVEWIQWFLVQYSLNRVVRPAKPASALVRGAGHEPVGLDRVVPTP